MAKVKSKVFIGSSSEGKNAASAFARVLNSGGDAICSLWWQTTQFQAGGNTLFDLISMANSHDFGLFVMTADDLGTSRGQDQSTIRDNVLFEYGLFLGALGSERTFAVVAPAAPGQPSVRVPSDLLGINIPRFAAKEEDLVAEANAAAYPIQQKIAKLGRFERPMRLVKDYEFKGGSPPGITVGIDPVQFAFQIERLQGKKLFAVGRKRNDGVPFDDDPSIVKGPAIKVPRAATYLELELRSDQVFGVAQKGDVVEFYLMAAPLELDVAPVPTISDLLDHGCDRAGGGGTEVS